MYSKGQTVYKVYQVNTVGGSEKPAYDTQKGEVISVSEHILHVRWKDNTGRVRGKRYYLHAELSSSSLFAGVWQPTIKAAFIALAEKIEKEITVYNGIISRKRISILTLYKNAKAFGTFTS